MLHARLAVIAGLACVFSDGTGITDRAFAQPAIERVEAKIRDRLLRPSSTTPSPPSPNPPSTTPETVPAGKVILPSTSTTSRPYLGITADDTNDRGRGVRVLQVHAAGPGAKAGLQAQDLITSAAGQRVRAVAEMAEMLEVLKPGDKLLLDVQRDNASLKVEVVLGQQPSATPLLNSAEKDTPATSKPTVLDFPEIKPPENDHARIEALEQRIKQLEGRIEQLEKAMPGKTQ
jgi:predicted metalloprotease with PDZ domain